MKNQANKKKDDLQMQINDYEKKMPQGYFSKPSTINVAIKNLHRYIEAVSRYVLKPTFDIEISATASAETLVQKLDNPKERNRNRCLQFMGIYQAMRYLDKQFERQMDTPQMGTPHFNSNNYKNVHHWHVEAISELNKKIEVVEEILYPNDPVLRTKSILEIFEPKPDKIEWSGHASHLVFLLHQMERKDNLFLGSSNNEKVKKMLSHFSLKEDNSIIYYEALFKQPYERISPQMQRTLMKIEQNRNTEF